MLRKSLLLTLSLILQESLQIEVNGIKWTKLPVGNGQWAENCDFSGFDLTHKQVPVEDCPKLCFETQDCTHFTWTLSRRGTCWMKSGQVSASMATKRNAPSIRCGYFYELDPVTEPTSINGINWNGRNWAFSCDFYGGNIAIISTQSHLCEGECRKIPQCTHFTWKLSSHGGMCSLKSGDVVKEDAFPTLELNMVCGVLKDSSPPTITSAPLSLEPEWHLIIGGKNVTDLKSVELFNWKTKEQCSFTELPFGIRIHSGLNFEGVYMYCGGYTYEEVTSLCFKYRNDISAWVPASHLLERAAAGSSNALVPGKGWMIFGGEGTKLSRSQVLKSPEGSWELGPELIDRKPDPGVCVVQLDDKRTVFLGGEKDKHAIVILEWANSRYVKKRERFFGKRWKSACAVGKDGRGNSIVFVAGGLDKESKGMESWNPLTGEVKRIVDLLPSEDYASFGLNHAQLVAIKGGTELLLYGGWQGEYMDDIWKYNIASDTWEHHSFMLMAREEHVVIPISDGSCKQLPDS